MSAFVHALRSFQTGDLSQDQLLSEVYRQLAIERVAPLQLIEILNEQRLKQPLPDDTHETLLSRITGWPQEDTVATRSSKEQSSISNVADAPATIVLGDQSGGADGIKVDPKSNRMPPPAVGSVLQGRFSLIALVGEGGMSRVYKAIDLRRVEAGAHDPYIAVKVLTVPFSHYFGSMAALQREAHKLQSLTHQNIVRVIDCDRDGQSVFMTMEYLPGESLYKKLRRSGTQGVPRDDAVTIITAIAHALEYAHRNHIVHGDLKPGNVIVDDKCDVKVIDFGMARIIARRGEAAAAPDNEPIALTPRYASPERLAGHAPEPSDDVYALACLSFEVLTGRHPFGGRVEEATMRAPTARAPRPTGLSRRHHKVLSRALEFDRARRTPDVAQFLKEFRAANRDSTGKRLAWFGIAAALTAAAAMMLLALAPQRISAKLFPALGIDVAPPAETILRDCPTCPLMTVLPAGRFEQGAADDDVSATAFERPRHAVTIGYRLAMSTNEVTVGEFKEFIDATHRDVKGCEAYIDGQWQRNGATSWVSPGFPQSAVHPVTCVSWNDAVAFTHWLSKKSAHSYRLPTASEWEYAERAGTNAAHPWGSSAASACSFANVADQNARQRYPGWEAFDCNDGYVGSAPVGSFKSNAFGLNDMLGNVFEWVQDCWTADYSAAPVDGSATTAGDCRLHEARGGSWFTTPSFVSASYRNHFTTDQRTTSVGFRVVRDMSK